MTHLDVLAAGLQLVFIGFNPSPASYESGCNYAGRSNRFYTILLQSGLVDVPVTARDSRTLMTAYGYGFTNIVERPTKTAAELTREDYTTGRQILRDKLERFRPSVVCYVGKGVYTAFSGRRNAVSWGFQESEQIAGVRDFVAPSSSGLVRMKLAEQVAIYAELAKFIRQAKAD